MKLKNSYFECFEKWAFSVVIQQPFCLRHSANIR